MLQRLATQDLTEAYQWAAERAPDPDARWLNRFQDALQTLENNPERCPLARENEKTDFEVREFLFGKRPYVFRVRFSSMIKVFGFSEFVAPSEKSFLKQKSNNH
ncbi:MAG: hypothetical protein Tsb009_04630 [Planctomycetaceae bacterium]